ncbi:CWF19-like protein 2 homolog isoform X1 [Amyelois transitella]|uniref:CWF19-like protein 2 homolog isoform X1 n=2 Tax=Amyelois transitella TaxID=680683 RepID=UPI00298FCFD1|nr:CWF19-like protein 2 homolog isoform X1 [Amyelois transitella]
MKEERKREKKSKKHKAKKHERKEKKSRYKSSSSTHSDSDEWIEKSTVHSSNETKREDWMAMTGMLKTYTKDDIKPKTEQKKNNIDSYNPATSSRELNPYWKDGGSGLPQHPDQFRKSRQFLKPDDEEDYYTRSSSSKDQKHYYSSKDIDRKRSYDARSSNWRKQSEAEKSREGENSKSSKYKVDEEVTYNTSHSPHIAIKENKKENLYLSDEKMNKLGAKIVKAEIIGDMKLVEELKAKLEAAREYRKKNPNAGEEDNIEGIMLMATSSTGNSRPLIKERGDPKSKGGKRKAETYAAGERTKYFGNDDKYNLQQMFQQEKYGNNYEDEEQLAKIAAKHKNPNDDLEDIFMDDISKNRNDAKDSEKERQRAINQHVRIEKSMEGCEYCIDSKNMLKHLMVSCGSKVYVALPARTSLVTGQCIITTIQHSTCVTALDEDVWEEILIYRKALTQFFNSQDMDVVFFETATRLHRFPHMVINCVPLPRDVGDMAAIYFKKALLECEAEWSMNKKVVDLKGKDIRKGIPKGLPYFWIDFGMDPGFAHVIEDQQLFPKTFAEEVIAGILDLDHSSWKNPRKEYGDIQRKKVWDFVKEWKPFDPIKSTS